MIPDKIPWGIYPPGEKKVFKLWLSGMREQDVALTLSISYAYVNETVRKCVDKLYNFTENIEKYKKVLKDDHRRRRHRNVDRSTVLTLQERRILRMWKIFGQSDARMIKTLGIVKGTLKRHKGSIRKKVKIDDIEHRNPDILSSIPDYSPYSLKLSNLEKKTADS